MNDGGMNDGEEGAGYHPPVDLEPDLAEIAGSEAFIALRRGQRRLALGLTLLTLFVYFGLFILPMAFLPDVLAAPLWAGAVVSRGIAAAALVITTGIGSAIFYTRRANRIYAPMVDDIIREIGERHKNV